MTPPRHRRIVALMAVPTLAAALAAQQQQQPDKQAVLGPPVPAHVDVASTPGGLLPFRQPNQDVQVPIDLWRDLDVMLGRAQSGDAKVSFDADGREVCDDPVWRSMRKKIEGEMFNMPAMFGIVLRDSRHAHDRELAAYGTFFVEDPKDVIKLIPFFAGEPERSIRQAAMNRSIEFLRVHLPESRDGPGGVEVPRYTLDAAPYIALLDVPDPRDQAQGLWFLRQVAEIRADAAKPLLGATHERLADLLVSETADVRWQARAFLRTVDPEHRKPPAEDADADQVHAWLAAIVHDVFPPIRPVAEGRIDLYPGDDVDRLVEVGRDVLQRGAIGEPQSGKASDGTFYRGFRIARLPEPLDQLRLPVGAVVVRINGLPVATSQQVLSAIEHAVEKRDAMLVEYLLDGHLQAMEYRLQVP